VWLAIRRRAAFTIKGARMGVSSTLPTPPCERWTVQAIVDGVVRARKSLGIRHVIDVFRDLAYVPEGWPLQMAPSHTAAGGLADTPFETLKVEPHYESSHVLYGYLPLGSGADRRVTFVVDGLDEPTWTVWVDRNNNQDLTDDGPPVRNEGTGRFAAQIEVTMHIATSGGDRPFAYKVWLWLAPPVGVSSPRPSQYQPLFYARSHYAGTIRLGGATYRVVAFERLHHDGLFEEGDICVDVNRNDTCDEPTEIVSASRPLSIRGRLYRVRVRGGGP
jgi:hypothetical protein